MNRTIRRLFAGGSCALLLSLPAFAESPRGPLLSQVTDEEAQEAREARRERAQQRLPRELRRDRTISDERERRDAIETDLRRLGLSSEEIDALGWEIQRYVNEDAPSRHFVAVLDDAWEAGCREECLEETAEALNEALDEGVAPARAAEIVRIAIEQEARASGRLGLRDEDFGEAVQERVEDRVARVEERTAPALEEERERRRRSLERQLGVERGEEPTGARRRDLEERQQRLEQELEQIEQELEDLGENDTVF